jgi:hypothetical protein
MKEMTTSVLGHDVPVSGVPTTLDEAVASAGGEQELVDAFVNFRKFHNTNTEARAAVVEAYEEVTGVKRETEQVKSPTKSDPERMVEKFAESEQQYADRVRAQTGQTPAQIWETIKEKVGTLEFKGKGEARVGGPRLAKMDTEYAQKLIAAGTELYTQAVAKLQQKNPGLTIEMDEAGVPKVESLAAALRANRARIEAAEKADLGVAA